MSATVRDMALIGSLRAEIVTVLVAFMEFFLIKAVATEQRCRVTRCTRTRKIGVKQGPKCMIAVGITDCHAYGFSRLCVNSVPFDNE